MSEENGGSAYQREGNSLKIYERGIANNVSKVGFSEEEVFVKERM